MGMMSIVLWFIAVLGIIFLLRVIVKKYSQWVDVPSTTQLSTTRARGIQNSERRIYTIDCTTNRNTTITSQNRCYDDTYYNQPPPDYSANNTSSNDDLSGNIHKEIIIKSKNELPTYEEVIKQIEETQQNCNNDNNSNNINRVDASLPADTSLPTEENSNTRTRSPTVI